MLHTANDGLPFNEKYAIFIRERYITIKATPRSITNQRYLR